MMESSSAFNFEDARSINFPKDSDRYLDGQIGSSTTAAIRDAVSIGLLGYAGTRHPQPSDDHLLKEAMSGNDQAFVELFKRYSGPLEQTIFRIVRNRQDTEDILQETMINAWRHLNGFRGNCRFYTWVTRIGINKSLMLLRKRKVRSEVLFFSIPSESNTIEVPEFPDVSPNPEQLCARKQISEVVLQEVVGLPIGLRDIFEHHYRENRSLEESADALGLTIAAAKSRLLRARRALRSSLKKRKISPAEARL
jgi:RNA polymerase sigma-70 factor (ECF subfamily)